MAQSLYVLFENAVGYGLFVVKEFDEMALLAPRVEQSVLDLGKFNSLVQTVHFTPFRSTVHALENMNCISEGVLHEDLKVLLEAHVPKSSKKLKVLLGINDAKIAAAILEELQINCITTGAVPEIMRGIRLHFSSMVKDGRLTEEVASKARLGLGHSYSRAKVKFNVNRVDNMIIQSIALLDQLDKDINTFSMRIREWYSYHFPELVKIVTDNYMYARVVRLIKDRKQMPEDHTELEEIVMDSAKSQAVLDAARVSMGMDISPIDLANIQELCDRVIGMSEFRQQLSQYLISRMQSVAPNLAALIGDQVGARLIAHAGSLTNLAKCPASTVQILGAEKALFRALKTRGNTPKYGLIFHSTFIGRAGAKNKGRISRYLANKCSIASRIDCFADTPSSIFGDHLRQQVEDRLKFFETGDAPSKNIDIMRQAVSEFTDFQAKEAKKKKKKEKKQKEAGENGDVTSQAETTMEIDEDETSKKKKKKKKKHQQEENGMETSQMETTFEADTTVEGETPKKKKKDKKKKADDSQADSILNTTTESVDDSGEGKKKKKKKKASSEADSSLNNTVDEDAEPKKKKRKSMDGASTAEEETPSKKEKKKKRKSGGGDD
ncbi:nucleolar protein 56-like isoform X2 [Babylonia areolata]|uniref:nucleolar protein 56-like isoform X1 n=1 Tax=Babylonia areolata TaxID=304850 RepID=UPI003FD2D90A